VTDSSATRYGTAAGTTSSKELNDRFLKLLVAQMNNQDPLNPLDNAEVTSQMAQINTVTGINNLTDTVTQMLAQFTQIQSLQAAQLTGRSVIVDSDRLEFTGADTPVVFGVDLPSDADKVAIEIRDANGQLVRAMQLGASSAGIQRLSWDGQTDAGDTAVAGTYTFTVKATSGTTELPAVPVAARRVEAVDQRDGSVRLVLQGGDRVAYGDVRQIL
jgi:flagellar basal-body rod modification protein FlgD